MKPPKPYPCTSCPYRRDVPSGVWSAEEYEKLPRFDGELITQPPSVFLCHQQDDTLCSGWVGCHDMEHSLGVRLAISDGRLGPKDIDAVLDYECPVPLFGSGAEAAEHGLADVEAPREEAAQVISKLTARRERRPPSTQRRTTMIIHIEIRDYECGSVDETLTPSRIERTIKRLLDTDGSDGIVIVTIEDDR